MAAAYALDNPSFRSLAEPLLIRSVPVKVGNVDERTGWEALADHVVRRRKAMGFDKQQDFAAKAGISAKLLGEIEGARRESYSRGTFTSLEDALLWRPGSVGMVVGGHEPDALPLPERPRQTLADIDDVELIARLNELTAEVARRLNRRPEQGPDGGRKEFDPDTAAYLPGDAPNTSRGDRSA